jgi:formate C-acetyltransferase
MLSATIPECLEKGLDAIARKSVSCSSLMMFGAIADVVDSPTMIKKYVYDRKELTLEEFVEILDKNFEGHELFRQKLLNDREKYGNNKDFPDSLAVDIDKCISGYLNHRKNAPSRGGQWFNGGYHVARQYYEQGKKTASLPSGRLYGEELAKNSSPCVGQNKEGATGAILSITKIDATNCVGDVCLDLGVLPSAVKGDDGLQALYGLVKTFFNRNGHALQINVVDAQTLRDAQKNPEKYADLQIRVAGWNVLWNNIPSHEQEGFIKQAEALI